MASEVHGYYIEEVIRRIFSDFDDIVEYNTKFVSLYFVDEDQLTNLSDRFVIPASGNQYLGKLAAHNYMNVNPTAYFNNIGFKFYLRPFQRQGLFALMDLNLPKNADELLTRMNSLANPKLNHLRRKLAYIRAEYLRKSK